MAANALYQIEVDHAAEVAFGEAEVAGLFG